MTGKQITHLLNQAKSVLNGDIKHLQMIPAAAISLLNLTNDENTTVVDLARIIETEPALAAQLLKLVNSAAYGLPGEITSISRAISLLGFAEVKKASLELLFFNNLIKSKKTAQFDQLYFWQHCLFVAGLGRAIATTVKHPDPDSIYAAGLLHDIGKVVLETYGVLTYSDFLAFFDKSENAIPENEKTFFGLTHSEVGYVFCQQWQLPDAITAAVYLHHGDFQDHALAKTFEQEIAIISLANFIGWMQGIGSVLGHNYPILQNDTLTLIDVELLNIGEILDNVDKEMRNIRDFYNIEFPNLNKLRATLVNTTLDLSRVRVREERSDANSLPTAPLFQSSLTAPHRSLNKDDFVPHTLEAIQSDFNFDRIMLLEINPERRSLVASYAWPKIVMAAKAKIPEILITSASAEFLTCLRMREPVLIDDTSWLQCEALKQQSVKAFIAVPVLRHNRLIGIIYADNALSQTPLEVSEAFQMVPIADELGIALNNARELELERKKSLTDPLTNLNNRRMLNEFMQNLYQEDLCKHGQIAVGFIDIDNFKRLNDDCGHQAGDDALKVIADILRSLTRPADCIGRYGGEEFLFILLDTTTDGVRGYTERIRAEVERRGKILSQRIKCDPLTISIGVVMHNKQYRNHFDIINAADKAMYQAKAEGRNRVFLKN